MSEAFVDGRIERKAKLSESVVSALRAQIIAGDFAVGEKLPTETRMSEIFGVSRTVVREAVAILSADGLVEPRHGAGVFVRMNPQRRIASIAADVGDRISQAINVLEVRMGIEIESAGLAAERCNASQAARIQEAFFEFDRLIPLGEQTGKADFAFHREIAAATNNPFYVDILDALGDRTIPCDRTSPWYSVEVLSPQYLMGLQREHLAVLQAITAGDPAGARDAMRRHLTSAQQRYRRRLAHQQDSYAAAAGGRRPPDTEPEPS
ncbi:FadR/GntR family transcriptional regulator [Aureimonas phyllosphaerae]|uniref:DNA-binding FadR family transcriptional regulator n=1 Tax=Aureimonas phyllosphaerae TaxID=1166078 RepID=A0A7W6C1A9_9HYPH|nr:FadR/GntR family transcriptional regulator [Aureimonas phyllosphaerae]MBB3937586.1 DNA-binding FadR family transcriptional regulator [Aureimonas phyllosphaerae]MBB3961614.1 DNA-binding FadR family transcriptional regulator [Aureimonas phyllosphaerae]SFF46604.1 transcriptional regulator, GntR family [Aureimonas phyllosphaerae]